MPSWKKPSAHAGEDNHKIDALTQRIELIENTNLAALAVATQAQDANVATNNMLSELQAKIRQLEALRQQEVIVKVQRQDSLHTITGLSHRNFLPLLQVITSLEPVDRNIWLAGPAGGGKTTVCHKIANAISLPFEYMNATDSKYDISGFRDAEGTFQDTPFYRIYKNGGIILIDEVDRNAPSATLVLNGATSNHVASFPCGMIERHPDCYIIAAGNTWGFGGDSNYIGAMKQDAAFLDRFVTLPWPYDETLEREAAGGKRVKAAQDWPDYCTVPMQEYTDIQDEIDAWIDVVQLVRKRAFELEAKVVISPRSSIKGAQLLRGGTCRSLVVEAIFGRYRSMSAWESFGQAAEDYAKPPKPVQTQPAEPTFRQTPDGILIIAEFRKDCAKCGFSIWPGDKVYWNPITHNIRHKRCGP